MKKVYFISGLGADKRAFSMLDLSFCEPIFIDWITPLPNESLEAYAARLREQITEPSPTIVGLSFGGMLATEIARMDPTAKCVLISSNKSSKEFPYYLRIGRYLPLYKMLPGSWMKALARVGGSVFGARDKTQRALFLKIVRDTDIRFTRWAIDSILRWKNTEIPGNIIHVHGSNDRLLPLRFVKADYVVKGGTHIMPMDHAGEISLLLREVV